MAYWITQFGTTALSQIEQEHETGLGLTAGGTLPLPAGGAHDPWGADQAPVQLPYTLRVSAELVHTTPGSLRTALYALRALHGERAKLYRTPDGGVLNSEWVWARLERLRVARRAANVLVLPIEMDFTILTAPWRGDDATVSTVLDASPKSITCTNGGNARISDSVITVTAAGSAVTNVQVSIAGESLWAWAGTLTVGNDLVIDCGAKTVRNNGVDAYSGFALDPLHTVSEWLRLEPGSNTVQVWRTGGDNATAIEIAFEDGWA